MNEVNATMIEDGLSAKLVQRGGMPQIEINGRPTAPLIFFFNTEVEWGWPHLEPQVRLAAKAGIHIYSFPLSWPWLEDGGGAPDYSEGEEWMRRFLAIDPQALFIPRLRCEGSAAWAKAHPEALINYPRSRPDEEVTRSSTAWMTSMASGPWLETLLQGLKRAIRHYESSPFADHILGYHPAGQNSNEWFHFEYFLYGPDVSEANQDAFRRWLGEKYGSDAALAVAWGASDVTLASARIPHPVPCSEAESADFKFDVFLTGPREQARIDYQEYASWLMSDRVLRICHLLRQETAGRKLVALFYGYLFELMGVAGGHNAMQQVLASPDVDLLASPISYQDRQPGGPASFMTAIDSVAANGKLWIVENDYRTEALDVSRLPEWMPIEGLGPKPETQVETLGVITRDFGSLYVHRCGTWWMDLISGGAFEDPAYWALIGARLKPLYDDLLRSPAPYRPEVAIIADEASAFHLRYLGCGEGETYNPLQRFGIHQGREILARTGVSLGYYYMNDFLAGRIAGAKVYLFINLYHVTDALIDQIHARLDAEEAVAFWQFAPGLLGEGGPDLERMRRLTGVGFHGDEGRLGSRGQGILSGLEWGEPVFVAPRLAVEDATVEPLGVYCEGGRISTARWRSNNRPGVFLGDARLSTELLARLFSDSGVHRWTHDGSVAQTDGRLLFVHAARPGVNTIHLPGGIQAEPLTTFPQAPAGGRIELEFKGHQTHILVLRNC